MNAPTLRAKLRRRYVWFLIRHIRFATWWMENVKPLFVVRRTRRAITRRRGKMYAAFVQFIHEGDRDAALMASGECFALDWVLRQDGPEGQLTSQRLTIGGAMPAARAMKVPLTRDPKERGH